MAAAVVWTLAFAAVLAAAWPRLLPSMPRGLSHHREHVLKPTSDRYPALRLRRIGYGWGWPGWQGLAIRSGQCVLSTGTTYHLSDRTVVSSLDYWLSNGRAGYAATRFHGSKFEALPTWWGALDETKLAQWLTLIGAPAEDAPAEAAELLALMRRPTFGPDDTAVLTHFTATTGGGVEVVPAREAAPTLAAASAIVWLAGLIVVVRLARPRRAHHGTGFPSHDR